MHNSTSGMSVLPKSEARTHCLNSEINLQGAIFASSRLNVRVVFASFCYLFPNKSWWCSKSCSLLWPDMSVFFGVPHWQDMVTLCKLLRNGDIFMWFSIDRSSMMMHDAWCNMMQSLTPCNQDQSSSFCSFFGSSFIEELRCLRSLGGKLSYQGGKSKAFKGNLAICNHPHALATTLDLNRKVSICLCVVVVRPLFSTCPQELK